MRFAKRFEKADALMTVCRMVRAKAIPLDAVLNLIKLRFREDNISNINQDNALIILAKMVRNKSIVRQELVELIKIYKTQKRLVV